MEVCVCCSGSCHGHPPLSVRCGSGPPPVSLCVSLQVLHLYRRWVPTLQLHFQATFPLLKWLDKMYLHILSTFCLIRISLNPPKTAYTGWRTSVCSSCVQQGSLVVFQRHSGKCNQHTVNSCNESMWRWMFFFWSCQQFRKVWAEKVNKRHFWVQQKPEV